MFYREAAMASLFYLQLRNVFLLLLKIFHVTKLESLSVKMQPTTFKLKPTSHILEN